MKEMWIKPDNNYSVSNLGRVKSFLKNSDGNILKQSTDNYGYKRVGIKGQDGKWKIVQVHRLVAKLFCDGQFEGAVVNHLDEDKSNNNFLNLKWCTLKENNNYGTAIERMRNKKSQPIYSLNPINGEVTFYKSMTEAEKQGYHSGHISACCKGKQRTHKGLSWHKI